MRRATNGVGDTVERATRTFPTVHAALDEVIRPLPESRRPGDADPLFVAVVHTVDDIRFSATSRRRDEVVERLAEYTLARAGDQLCACDAAYVRALIACDCPDAAVTAYFAVVGQRWDKEWLVTTVVAAPKPRVAARATEMRR